jgi:hypothetical protein
MEKEGFVEKRNLDISHKALPETFSEHRHRHIKYRQLVVGISVALRLMKQIDRRILGPSAPHLWREMRKKRYHPMAPPSAGYLIMPYMRLAEEIRAQIVIDELKEGKPALTEMTTTINGEPTKIAVAKEWGGIVVDGRLLMLPDYPIQELQRIEVGPPRSDA